MIELKNINFEYKTNDSDEQETASFESENGALKNLNLSVRDGEFLLLTGGSGCGKTTILRLINGLIPNFFEGQVKGSVTIDGVDVSKAELYETAKSVSTVFQNPRSQFFNVDTNSELAFACENRGMPEKEIISRIEDAVKDFHLEPLMNRSLFDLSGGQKQKIACVSAAVTGNQIILLDEPSANLDLKTIDELAGLLKKWKDEGKTIIVAEHRISYLWHLADRMLVLKNGEIIKEFSRPQMDKITEDELHGMGLRTNRHSDFVSKPQDHVPKGGQGTEENQREENIILQDFYYKYKNGHVALDIPHLEIPAGQITAVTGNNGDGKTTFLNCLCGLGRRSKGSMIYKGKICNRRRRQKMIFLVMQDVNHQLFTESVLDEVLISQNEENQDEAMRILSSLDLEKFSGRHPQSLSGGQKQRVAVASAIASGRDILLFDEPTSGLDYSHMMQIGKILRNLKEQGKTVIVVTHDRELIKECCDAEICLHDFNHIK